MLYSNETKKTNFDNSLENDKTNQEKKEYYIFAFAGPEQIVHEGSKVFLEGHSFPSDQKLIWKQIEGPKVDLKYKRSIYNGLKFILIIISYNP